MRRLADAMGIRAPSLYKHVESKEELEALLIADVFREIGERFHQAIASAPKKQALAELARVYRAWALAHPHLYRLLTEGELPRDRLPRRAREAWAARAGRDRRGRRSRPSSGPPGRSRTA